VGLAGALVVLVAGGSCSSGGGGEVASSVPARATTGPPAGAPTHADVRARLAALESRYDARLGVLAVDTGTGQTVQYRPDTRFPFASTIKALAAGAVLAELSRSDLRQRVRWTSADLVDHSPVTELHVEGGLPVSEVIDAALTYSDNTAGNLLMRLVDGPDGLEARLRAVGDDTTSVDRTEPLLNSATPGDLRDTTTPRALATTFATYLLGEALPVADRRLMNQSLSRSTTGTGLVRAGVPPAWQVADKSGTAGYGTRNDVAVVRPPGRDPLVIAVMSTRRTDDAEPSDALVAAATRLVVAELS
jgi:beta-lactamase class A